MAFAATSLDVRTSSCFNSRSETDTQDWFILSTKFLKQLDSATKKYKTQAEFQNFELATHESISIHACRAEKLAEKKVG